jgi:prophage regulatory protein
VSSISNSEDRGDNDTKLSTRGMTELNERAPRLPQVCRVTGLGGSMIFQMQAEMRFPQRIKLGERAVGWLEREVQEWLAQRIENSRRKTSGSS